MSTNFFLKQTCENVSTRWDGKAANSQTRYFEFGADKI